jgi:RNA polymerase sigma-70 factor (ECF subfamily)
VSSSASRVADLVTQYLPALRAFVRVRMGRQLRDREESCDIVQSVTREVLRQADRFEHGGESGFRRWLFTTAHRKISNRLTSQRAQKRGGGTADAPLPEEIASPSATPSQHASARERHASVEAAFAALSEEQREVVVASRLLGMSHAEIAQRLGKSEVAVRKTLSRGLARLIAILAEDQEDG